jgi:hypothetical protein
VGDEELEVAPNEDEEEDDVAPVAPRFRWSEAAEITGSLVALLLVTLSVLAFYLVGGLLLELIATAAPAVLVIVAAVFLARYLRRRSSDAP